MLLDPKTTLGHATERAWTLLDEFKAFAFKGIVVDLAIGVIIGGASHNLIDSLVKSLIMLLIAILIPGQRPYTHWRFTSRGSTVHIGLPLGDIAHFLTCSLAGVPRGQAGASSTQPRRLTTGRTIRSRTARHTARSRRASGSRQVRGAAIGEGERAGGPDLLEAPIVVDAGGVGAARPDPYPGPVAADDGPPTQETQQSIVAVDAAGAMAPAARSRAP
jgi:hypothetical protein